jgi:hypothetical protein
MLNAIAITTKNHNFKIQLYFIFIRRLIKSIAKIKDITKFIKNPAGFSETLFVLSKLYGRLFSK